MIRKYNYSPTVKCLIGLIHKDIRNGTNIIIDTIIEHNTLIRGNSKLPLNLSYICAKREKLFDYIIKHNLCTQRSLDASISAADTYDQLQHLINSGAKTSYSGVNVFIKAINNQNLKIMQLLVDNGFNIYSENCRVIWRAIEMHAYEVLDWLFGNGLDPNYKDGILLAWAMRCCYSKVLPVEMSKYLVEKGTNPYALLKYHKMITRHSRFYKKDLIKLHLELQNLAVECGGPN